MNKKVKPQRDKFISIGKNWYLFFGVHKIRHWEYNNKLLIYISLSNKKKLYRFIRYI